MTPRSPATEPRTEALEQAVKDGLLDLQREYGRLSKVPGSKLLRLHEMVAEAAQGAAPLDPLLPDTEVAETLRKLARQHHGIAGHRDGSWTYCYDRWCRDAVAVLDGSEGAAPRAEGPLRAALERLLAVAMTEEEDVSPATQDEWIAAIKQANEVLNHD